MANLFHDRLLENGAFIVKLASAQGFSDRPDRREASWAHPTGPFFPTGKPKAILVLPDAAFTGRFGWPSLGGKHLVRPDQRQACSVPGTGAGHQNQGVGLSLRRFVP